MIIIDALADNITYDQKTKRYRYKGSNKPGEPITGSFVSRDKVISLQKNYLNKISKQFIDLVPRIKAGEIGVYKEAADLLKKIHLSHAIIAANGIDKLTNSQLGTIGNTLKQQYYQGKDSTTGKPYGLKHLFKDVASDPNYSSIRLSQRLKMYALSGELSGSTVTQSIAIAKGETQMLRQLGATHIHCDDCIKYASVGWQLIGMLPLPKTACVCKTNCRCVVIYK